MGSAIPNNTVHNSFSPSNALSYAASFVQGGFSLVKGGTGVYLGGAASYVTMQITSGILARIPLTEDRASQIGNLVGGLLAANYYADFASLLTDSTVFTTGIKIGATAFLMYTVSKDALSPQYNNIFRTNFDADIKGAVAGCIVTMLLHVDGTKFLVSTATGVLAAYTVSHLSS